LYRWARGWFSRSVPPALVGPPPPIPLPGPGECSITFIGHATALIRYEHGRLLTDPCFATALYGLKRARPPAIPAGALEGVDAVLITHRHADHLHAPSLAQLDRSVTIVVPAGEGGVDRLGFQRVVELDEGATLSLAGIDITAVPAAHRVGPFGGRRAVGYVVGGAGPKVYFSGDTGYFEGFAAVGRRFSPDVAILPISGYRPRALRADHLSPLDAVYALEDLCAELLIPVHHSSFALGYEPISEPLIWLKSLEGARQLAGRIGWLQPGESCVARRRAGPRELEGGSILKSLRAPARFSNP
jgi:L-ascorbate metabolism protein UlaG (beta-lactamase superfamily)